MSSRIAKNLPFRGPTCPRCAELCDDNAVVCHDCGCRLGVDDATLKRWCRVRGAIQFTSVDVDADQHANLIVGEIEKRRGAQPWPATKPKEAA